MKIKVKSRPYRQVIDEYNSQKHVHIKPKKPNILFRTLLRLVAIPDLIATRFKCEKIGMEKLEKGEPTFIIRVTT